MNDEQIQNKLDDNLNETELAILLEEWEGFFEIKLVKNRNIHLSPNSPNPYGNPMKRLSLKIFLMTRMSL